LTFSTFFTNEVFVLLKSFFGVISIGLNDVCPEKLALSLGALTLLVVFKGLFTGFKSISNCKEDFILFVNTLGSTFFSYLRFGSSYMD